jgi:hypothetical protein
MTACVLIATSIKRAFSFGNNTICTFSGHSHIFSFFVLQNFIKWTWKMAVPINVNFALQDTWNPFIGSQIFNPYYFKIRVTFTNTFISYWGLRDLNLKRDLSFHFSGVIGQYSLAQSFEGCPCITYFTVGQMSFLKNNVFLPLPTIVIIHL